MTWLGTLIYVGGVVASFERKRGFWDSMAWPAGLGALAIAAIVRHEKGSKEGRDG